MGCCGGGGDGGAAKAQAAAEAKREADIQSGIGAVNTAFSGFNNDFFTNRQNDYIKYAMPQLTSQFQQTNRVVNYGLADRGLGNSSIGLQQNNQLGQELNVQKQNVADQGLALAQQLQQQVGTQKSNIINTLEASADPNLAAQQALTAAGSLSAPNPLQPLGNAFQQFSNIYLANRIGNQQQGNNGYNYPNAFAPVGSSGGSTGGYNVR